MPSQAARVVEHADLSLNTELDVLNRLSIAAQLQGRRHGIVLMVELGDLREGILPGDLESVVRQARRFPNLDLRGIGTNLACQSGVAPDDRNMAELSRLASSLERSQGITLDLVSGGNSANLDWALGTASVGRVNDLRLGEAILLGCEPLHRRPIDGLRTDAFTLVAEVIEAKAKPTRAWGEINQTAFGLQPRELDRGTVVRAILALGRQDVDPDGLRPPEGVTILGASSDHLVLDGGPTPPKVGAEVRFGLDYGALLRAMTSPFVTQVLLRGDDC
jgi:predicted amino acid racemase